MPECGLESEVQGRDVDVCSENGVRSRVIAVQFVHDTNRDSVVFRRGVG